MTEFYEKTIQKLELPAVLELLAEQACSETAKEQCRRLRPLEDADEIRRLQRETTEACRILSLKGSPSFHGACDVSHSLDRADRGGCLSSKELLRVASLLRCTRSVKSYAETDAVSSQLDPLFAQLTPNKYLEEKLTNSILSEDEIADCASSELADIRRHIRGKSAKIRETLQKMISSPAYAKILQEPIITIRGDRFVVPVKSECKGEVPGLIHDVSASGSTLFIEPMQAVQANNELRELFAAEQQETERILAEFSADVAAHRSAMEGSFAVLIRLDCIFARAKLSFVMKAGEPDIRENGGMHLNAARHPLIAPDKVVPISVRLGEDFDALIITGPNTGGKTVTLKTIGLFTLMAECGLHIPAEDGSAVTVFSEILADIGDEQSIAQSLSTFSAHMKNIVEILKECAPGSLVLFDELGAGTDPAEGAALAVALIEACRLRGASVAATTHYAELKAYAMRTPGVINACCEFNVETLQPTYRLLIGVPGKSNAFAISRRLGLPESVLDKAHEMLNGSAAEFEDLLGKLEQQRQQMETARAEAERLHAETVRQKEKSDQYYAEIRKEKERAAQTARREAQRIIDDARRTADEVQAELKELRKRVTSGEVAGSNAAQAELRKKLNDAEEQLQSNAETVRPLKPSGTIRVGDTVELLKFGTSAVVLSVGKDGVYELQAGALKLTAKASELCLSEAARPAAKTAHPRMSGNRPLRKAAQTELDLRGMNADEAVAVLEKFLDDALLGNLSCVRIIHGKGTGVLRAAVRECLNRYRRVKSFRLGVYGEGEDGVTIAELK